MDRFEVLKKMSVVYKLFARSYKGCFKLAIPFLTYHNPIIYDYLDKFEEQLGIDKTINCFKESDIDGMAKYALKEVNPLYPVPVMWDYNKMVSMYYKIQGK